jgi:hypothetical protein
MKKVVTFRFDPELLAKLRAAARTENRTAANMLETILKRALEKQASGEGDTAW